MTIVARPLLPWIHANFLWLYLLWPSLLCRVGDPAAA